MSGVGDHAYSHCLAVLGDPAAASEAAAAAVRAGGRSRWAVLAHARHEALQREPVAHDAPEPGADLLEVALFLAAERPAEERALVDLADRHDLDRAALGRVLAAAPADVAAQISAVGDRWTDELDPLLLAWLGPGECAGLATILPDEREAIKPHAAPRVRAHVEECEVCSDRKRAMVSVRTLVGSAPLQAAPEGVAASSRRRRRRPVPIPAAVVARPRRMLWIAAGAVAVLALGVAAIAVVRSDTGEDDTRLTALTAAPAESRALALSPNRIGGDAVQPVSLRNRSAEPVKWTATTNEWLSVQPSTGELRPGETARVQVSLAQTAPEGDVRATVTFSADDGSSVALQYGTVVEHPPDIDARAEACTVIATVEDEAAVATVELHWHTGQDASLVPMTAQDEVWQGVLPSDANALTWWVRAADARGNDAATVRHELGPFCGRT